MFVLIRNPSGFPPAWPLIFRLQILYPNYSVAISSDPGRLTSLEAPPSLF